MRCEEIHMHDNKTYLIAYCWTLWLGKMCSFCIWFLRIWRIRHPRLTSWNNSKSCKCAWLAVRRLFWLLNCSLFSFDWCWLWCILCLWRCSQVHHHKRWSIDGCSLLFRFTREKRWTWLWWRANEMSRKDLRDSCSWIHIRDQAKRSFNIKVCRDMNERR